MIHTHGRLLLSLLVGLWCLAGNAATARAYNSDTHSRLAELAVRSMSEIDHARLPVPPGEGALFAQYLAAIQGAPEKLVLLRTGLPRRQGDGTSIESGGAYPFGDNHSACELYGDDEDTLDLMKVEEFRILDLRYLPVPENSCQLVPALRGRAEVDNLEFDAEGIPVDPGALQRRVLELTLGVHGIAVDHHLHDTTLWFRPTNAGVSPVGIGVEASSRIWDAGVGTLLLPFVCFYNAVFEDGCDFDDSYDLARQYNPVDYIQGWFPGIGNIQESDYTTLWHFLHVDDPDPEFNDVRGMRHERAGPSMVPGAVDVVITAATFASGMSLKARSANGTTQYGQYDRVHRTWQQWQAHPIGVTEFSPIQHLARYGWERFIDGGAVNSGHLAWPLHALGDAAAPHHVVGTTAWGHRPFEDLVDHDQEDFLPSRSASAQTQQLERVALKGFHWWKLFRTNQDVSSLVVELALDTRDKVLDQDDWAYFDPASTLYHTAGAGAGEALYDFAVMDDGVREATQDILEESSGAQLAFLAVAATHVGSGPPRADVDCPTGQTFSVQLSQPGCTATPSPAPPRESIEDAGVDSISGPETTDGGALDGGACEQPCNIELPCPSGMTCLAGCCRFTDPR
jgi:hypothetical protein